MYECYCQGKAPFWISWQGVMLQVKHVLLIYLSLSSTQTFTTLSSLTGNVCGKVLFNGQPLSFGTPQRLAYVQQIDLHISTLTVAETIQFTARLRLGTHSFCASLHKRCEAVMEDLRLLTCRNSLVGDGTTRGISGGEVSRTYPFLSEGCIFIVVVVGSGGCDDGRKKGGFIDGVMMVTWSGYPCNWWCVTTPLMMMMVVVVVMTMMAD